MNTTFQTREDEGGCGCLGCLGLMILLGVAFFGIGLAINLGLHAFR